MTEQKKFDLVKYILEKHNIQGEIVNYEFGGLANIEVNLEIEYDMYMPVMINKNYINEGELQLEYYTITDGHKILVIPYSIEMPNVFVGGDTEPYYIGCFHMNKETGEEYKHWLDHDVMLILDRKVLLLETWVEEETYDTITKVIELGTIPDNTWVKIKMIDFPRSVITDEDNMNTYKRICEQNKN